MDDPQRTEVHLTADRQPGQTGEFSGFTSEENPGAIDKVECIGKAHRPYEFGVMSIATTLHRFSAGGQFIAHAKALPGNPYDGHTRDRDPGDRDADRREPCPRQCRPRPSRPQRPARPQVQGLYLRRRRITETIKSRVAPPFRRRTGHRPREKAEHRMGRNYLAGTHGDAANAVLAAAGYNFRRLRLIGWLLLSAIPALTAAADHKTPLTAA